MEIRKVQAVGKGVHDKEYNSVAVVVPKKYMTELGLGKGDYVKLRLEGKQIILEKPDN